MPSRSEQRRRQTDPEERTLPQNLEAERCVLGAVLAYNNLFELAAEKVSEGDFYRDAHRRIWRAILRLLERRVVVDLVTVKEELRRADDLEEVGGPAYVASLIDGIPRSTNIGHYAGIVREKAVLRELIDTANRVIAASYVAEAAPEEIIRDTDRTLIDLQRKRSVSRMRSVGESVGQIFDRLEWRAANAGKMVGIPTGFAQIDELTLGWRKKDYIVVAARPSIGKTIFAMNTATAAAMAGKHVAVVSYEMRREQLEDRLLASLTGIPFRRVEQAAFSSKEYALVSHALETIKRLPLYIDDRAGQYVGDIRNTCRRLRNEHGLDMVVIDYVQLIPAEQARRGSSRNEQITEISRAIKELADELDVPIMVLSQLNRPDERRSDPRPKLTDLRESGSLEQDADEVNFLHRPNHKVAGTTNWIREKARNGPTGTINLTVDLTTLTFTDGGEDLPEPVKPTRGKKGAAPPPAPDLPLEEPPIDED